MSSTDYGQLRLGMKYSILRAYIFMFYVHKKKMFYNNNKKEKKPFCMKTCFNGICNTQ